MAGSPATRALPNRRTKTRRAKQQSGLHLSSDWGVLHKIYPYLLRGLKIDCPNQVWSTDITYIRMLRGFLYLCAVIDWHSRAVLSWRLSNTMDVDFCIETLEDALKSGIKPEIFNTDQGSQFTSPKFTQVLLDHKVQISMDGRGRA